MTRRLRRYISVLRGNTTQMWPKLGTRWLSKKYSKPTNDWRQSGRGTLWLKKTCRTCMQARWAADIDADRKSRKTRARKSNSRSTQTKRWSGNLRPGRRQSTMSMMRISTMSSSLSDTTRRRNRMTSAPTLTSITLMLTLGHCVVPLKIPNTTKIGGMIEDFQFTCQGMSVMKKKLTRYEWPLSSSLELHYLHTCGTISLQRKSVPRIYIKKRQNAWYTLIGKQLRKCS